MHTTTMTEKAVYDLKGFPYGDDTIVKSFDLPHLLDSKLDSRLPPNVQYMLGSENWW